MRRPTFKRWIEKELRYLSGLETLNLRKLVALAQDGCPRLIEPLLLYAIEAKRTEALLELVWREDVITAYTNVLDQLSTIESIESLALNGNETTQLPHEYRKFLTSYKAAYYKPETDAASKQIRWERSKQLQLQKGVSNAEIYRALGLNPGNINSYMKHGEIDKVSLENATAIMKYLFSY